MLRASRYSMKHIGRSFTAKIENNPLYPDTREEFAYLKANYGDKLAGRKAGYNARLVNKFVKSVKTTKDLMSERSVEINNKRKSWENTYRETFHTNRLSRGCKTS